MFLICAGAACLVLGTRLPCQTDTHTEIYNEVSKGPWGEGGWDKQMLHPATALHVRAEVAGPEPALPALLLNLWLCLISVQRQS